MDRAERTGFGIALVGHVALFALLSLRLMPPPPVPSTEHPIEVSLVQDVAPTQASPAPAPPAPSQAPEQGPPEEAAPPPPEPVPAPKPAPPKPAPVPASPKPVPPKPAPPKPAPKPAPVKPTAKAADADRLAAVVADAERADADRAAKATAKAAAHAAWVEKVRAENAAKADKARAAAEKAQADKAAAVLARAEAAKAATAKAEAAKLAAAARPRGSRLGADFLKGLSATPAKAPATAAAPGAMNAKATADIASAIQRQIQPCADRQVNPGPGAERIRVAINLKLNRDGSLAAPPRVVNHDGLDVENRRYLDRVDDLAIAAFTGCAPLRGLPLDLYDVPNGWRSLTMRYKLPG